jgi:hypothetical protein
MILFYRCSTLFGNTHCLFWESYETHKYSLWAKIQSFIYIYIYIYILWEWVGDEVWNGEKVEGKGRGDREGEGKEKTVTKERVKKDEKKRERTRSRRTWKVRRNRREIMDYEINNKNQKKEMEALRTVWQPLLHSVKWNAGRYRCHVPIGVRTAMSALLNIYPKLVLSECATPFRAHNCLPVV